MNRIKIPIGLSAVKAGIPLQFGWSAGEGEPSLDTEWGDIDISGTLKTKALASTCVYCVVCVLVVLYALCLGGLGLS